MADGVNPAMNAMKTSCPHPAGEALPANPETFELRERDDTVLPGRNSGNDGVRVGIGEFLTHVRE
jgi:hypothetical protein